MQAGTGFERRPELVGRAIDMPMQLDYDHEPIFVPSAERGQLIAAFPLSVRLANVLEAAKVRLSGDLHGRSFAEIARFRNCGKKTINELREIVRSLQVGDSENPPPCAPRRDPNVLQVSPGIREILLAEVPLSVRLGNVMRAFGHVRLGDLHGTNTNDLLKVRNCGRKCIVELRELLRSAEAGEFTAIPVCDFGESLRVVARAIDHGLKKIPARDRQIFEQRLFGNDGEPRTLENVGDEVGMTRERVRQIVKVVLARIRSSGGPILARAIEALAEQCDVLVIPVTPELFTHRAGTEINCGERTAHFYVRVLDYLAPVIPAWPPGSTREGSDDPQVEAVNDEIEGWLRTTGAQPTAAEAIAHLRTLPTWKKLPTSLFLTALRRSRKVVVNFPEPDYPKLQLRRLRLFDISLLVLAESEEPLPPEEIIDRARARFGTDAVALSGRTAENALTAYPGVFRLGPRSFGLRQHFASNEEEWPLIRDRFATLLRKESRPISSVEVLDKKSVTLPSGVNSYELAELIREDDRFLDLGRRLFGLAEWGAQEREHIKDLLPRVLAEVGRPLTVPEIYERLTKLRSATFTGLANILKSVPGVCSLGLGHYGLRDWGDSRKESLVSKRWLVERVVRRSEPPVSFATLCGAFGIPAEGDLAGILWKSCAGSDKLRRAPDRKGAATLLLHKTFSLEQALASIARTLGRAAPAYELEWELRAKYGDLFARIGLRQIEERLAGCRRFLRNTAGAFFLDADLDLEDFDLDALRAASAKALTESSEILSCEDLLDRLELQGFEVEEVSAGMLASILRGAEGLQEVGRHRFRAT
jgi:hypothetical protein